MTSTNTWLSGLDQLTARQIGKPAIGQLLNREELAIELNSFYRLTGLTVAIFSTTRADCLTVSDDSPKKSEFIAHAQEFLPKQIKLDEQGPKLWPMLHKTDSFRLALAPLAVADSNWGFLVVGQPTSASAPNAAVDNSQLLLGLNYLHESLRHRLIEAARHYQEQESLEPLKEQAELFRTIFTEAPWGITINTDETGKYLAVNPAFCDISGFSQEETLGQSSFSHARQTAQSDEQLKAHQKVAEDLRRNGRVGPVELQTMTKRGQRNVLFNAKALRLGGENCVIAITLDITEHKAAERTLRDNEALFSSIFENSPLPIVITRLRDNVQIKASRAYYRISGYDENETIGISVADRIPEEYRQFHEQFAKQLIQDGRLENIETWIKRKNGQLGRVLFSSEVVELSGEPHAISIAIDVDERYRAEEARRISEERYRLVAEFTGQLHYEWDLESGALKWEGCVSDVLGYSPEEMARSGIQGWKASIHPADRNAVLKELETAKNENRLFHSEYRMRKADGSYVNIEDDGTFLKDDQGKINRMIGVCKNVTQRKKSEQELKQRNEELMRFTFTVSHDLRSPLITIKSFLGLLEQDIEQKAFERIPKHFAFINKAATKMTALLDELLELSRVGRVNNPSVEVRLQEIVREAAELVHGRIEEKNVELSVTKEPILLFGDRTRLVEIFQNIIDNATKFFGDQPQPRIEIGAELIGGEWWIFVRDNGIGVEPCYLKKIFGLFEKLDSQIEGTGIGLALVQRIIEVHGGKIEALSEGLGQGTTFRFTLAGTKRGQV